MSPGRTQRIYDELSDGLRRFLRRRLPDEATAEDVLQDVFLRIHQRIDQLGDEDRLAGWVFSIARNTVADHYRRRRPEAPLPEDPVDESRGEADLASLAGWVAARVDDLPEETRQAVRMTELDGVSQREAAERLGLPASTLKSRVQRGRARLRKALLECCHVELDRRGLPIEVRERAPCCEADGEAC